MYPGGLYQRFVFQSGTQCRGLSEAIGGAPAVRNAIEEIIRPAPASQRNENTILSGGMVSLSVLGSYHIQAPCHGDL